MIDDDVHNTSGIFSTNLEIHKNINEFHLSLYNGQKNKQIKNVLF